MKLAVREILRHSGYACHQTERTQKRGELQRWTVFMTLVEGEGKKTGRGSEERASESWGITQKNAPVRSCYLWHHLQLTRCLLSRKYWTLSQNAAQSAGQKSTARICMKALFLGFLDSKNKMASALIPHTCSSEHRPRSARYVWM